MTKSITILLVSIMTIQLQGQSTSDINWKVVEYTLSKEGKRVNRGECWDLVAEALDYSGASWKRPGGFGEKINYDQDTVLPGDIIEFKNTRFVLPDRSSLHMAKHFAVITEVSGPGKYVIGHQNYGRRKRVGFMNIDLRYKKRGRVTIYRPKSR